MPCSRRSGGAAAGAPTVGTGSRGTPGQRGHPHAGTAGHSPALPVPWEGTLGTRRVPRHLRLSRWAAGFAAGPAWHGGLRAAAQPLRQLGSPHPRLASGT